MFTCLIKYSISSSLKKRFFFVKPSKFNKFQYYCISFISNSFHFCSSTYFFIRIRTEINCVVHNKTSLLYIFGQFKFQSLFSRKCGTLYFVFRSKLQYNEYFVFIHFRLKRFLEIMQIRKFQIFMDITLMSNGECLFHILNIVVTITPLLHLLHLDLLRLHRNYQYHQLPLA